MGGSGPLGGGSQNRRDPANATGSLCAMAGEGPELARPGVVDLLVGALWGRATYRSAARLGMARPLLAVLAMLLLVSIVLGVQQYFHLGAQIATARDSALWLMPRLNIAGGLAEAQAELPRVLESERFVVFVDTGESPEIPKAPPGDTRTRFLVLRTALVVFSIDRPLGNALGWDQLNAVLGPVSVDGPELIAALDDARLKMVVAVLFLRGGLVLVAILLGTFLGVALYRVVFFARTTLPSARALRGVAALAGVPGVAAAGLVSLVGGGDGSAAIALVIAGGSGFFIAAAGIEAADERSGA